MKYLQHTHRKKHLEFSALEFFVSLLYRLHSIPRPAQSEGP